jgi:cytochrome P450
MLAGYETTSTALQYCAYVLTRYPEEQQKLYEEISHYFDENVIINSN